jgi:hypothetical protein
VTTNLAGSGQRILNRNSSGYFSVAFDGIYTEQWYYIGNWIGGEGDYMKNASINFLQFSTYAPLPQWVFTGGGVSFEDSSFRYYGYYNRTHWQALTAPISFTGCSFDDIPYVFSNQSNVAGFQGNGNVQYINCGIGTAPLDSTGSDVIEQTDNTTAHLCYGNYRILSSDDWSSLGIESWMNVLNWDPVARLDLSGPASFGTIGGSNNSSVVTPNSPLDLNTISTNQMIINSATGAVLGIINSINTGAGTFTVYYIPNSVTAGSYSVQVLSDLYVVSFIGVMTSGSNTITGVVPDRGSLTNLVNQGGAVRIMGFFDGRTQLARITAWDGTSVLTIDRNASQSTPAGQLTYFSNCNIKKEFYQRYSNPIPNSYILGKGHMFGIDDPASGGEKVFMCTGTGYYGVTSPIATVNELT